MITAAKVLSPILTELGVPATALSRLLAHAEAVRREGERLGLVSKGDLDSIELRHTGDSLLFALARRPTPGESWVDLGSGGGFPGLVLAVCFPATSFTLVESNRRKAGFLEIQVIELGLDNVVVRAERAEDIDERFEAGTARAVADPAEALHTLISLLRIGGVAIVAGTGAVRGARAVSLARPDVDSPGSLFMMSRGT